MTDDFNTQSEQMKNLKVHYYNYEITNDVNNKVFNFI